MTLRSRGLPERHRSTIGREIKRTCHERWRSRAVAADRPPSDRTGLRRSSLLRRGSHENTDRLPREHVPKAAILHHEPPRARRDRPPAQRPPRKDARLGDPGREDKQAARGRPGGSLGKRPSPLSSRRAVARPGAYGARDDWVGKPAVGRWLTSIHPQGASWGGSGNYGLVSAAVHCDRAISPQSSKKRGFMTCPTASMWLSARRGLCPAWTRRRAFRRGTPSATNLRAIVRLRCQWRRTIARNRRRM